MIRQSIYLLLIAGVASSPAALAQAQDMAAERARIANQRIQVEAARIAEEEKRRAEAEAAEAAALKRYEERLPLTSEANARTQAVVAVSNAGETKSAPPSAPVATDRLGMSRMLEHLRVLGELRDSGYVSDAEFERIKQKILDGEL